MRVVVLGEREAAFLQDADRSEVVLRHAGVQRPRLLEAEERGEGRGPDAAIVRGTGETGVNLVEILVKTSPLEKMLVEEQGEDLHAFRRRPFRGALAGIYGMVRYWVWQPSK